MPAGQGTGRGKSSAYRRAIARRKLIDQVQIEAIARGDVNRATELIPARDSTFYEVGKERAERKIREKSAEEERRTGRDSSMSMRERYRSKRK